MKQFLVVALAIAAVGVFGIVEGAPTMGVTLSETDITNGGVVSANFTCVMSSDVFRARILRYTFVDSDGEALVGPVNTFPSWTTFDDLTYFVVIDFELDAWGPSGTYQFIDLVCIDDLSQEDSHPDVDLTVTNNLVPITPILNSVTLDNTTSIDETPIVLSINVTTNAPPDSWRLHILRPSDTTLADTNIIETVWTETPPGSEDWIGNHVIGLSEYLQNGLYDIVDLTVTNSRDLTSTAYSGPLLSIDVQNTVPAYSPSILFGRVLNSGVNAGEFALLEVNATSNAPLTELEVTLSNPNGAQVTSGLVSAPFSVAATDVWTRTQSFLIPADGIDGIYTFSGLIVTNEGDLSSPAFQDIAFRVGPVPDNSDDSPASSPLSPSSSSSSSLFISALLGAFIALVLG